MRALANLSFVTILCVTLVEQQPIGKKMSSNFKRIAIVTGATSGIGEATVKKFIAEGFGVVGNGRNSLKLTALEVLLSSL